MKHDAIAWKKKREYNAEELALADLILGEIRAGKAIQPALRANPLPGGRGFLAKHALVAAYYQQVEAGIMQPDPELLARIRMKPIRTLSGVATITVLTKPAPCPGECIFCPSEENMPQSYLSDEPGARRGVENNFDPYLQVSSRLKGLYEVGHPTDKIELLILGGSWSAYPKEYQEWFVRRCLEAMNEENPEDLPPNGGLKAVQKRNAKARHRNVGMVVETRPDLVNRDELIFYRNLGVTKLQIGVQSLDERILALNRRGHTLKEMTEAIQLIREAGFKIVAHWMPNLLGATLDSDRADYARLWEEGSVQADELKIYPCQLLKQAELYKYWERGEYKPYTEEELIKLLAEIKPTTPRYCRINRVIRDIPSPHVVEGNRNTSLRQNLGARMQENGLKCQCIRCREVRNKKLDPKTLQLNDLMYDTGATIEHFISFDTQEDELAGFLRLSMPKKQNPLALTDLEGAAIIREVHVFGQSLEIGADKLGAAQHLGLGKSLIEKASALSLENGFKRLAVISAIGTQEYYRKRGFAEGALYMVKDLL
ncbi:MAG: tRNA uridine(34) 5-carboxymethylaminomethyl modification radical SAM/GNAT enzyme Elp3 [Anaerolineaceae bacterium]|nr:tRNA uridine(34) 5-carboxymethylaminomethyl modification radical SAM/GNAT enzyme Elp3 [Anaerolineaceae bacterium]